MKELLDASTGSFLADVSAIAPRELRSVPFGSILEWLVTWSSDSKRRLFVRAPGHQNTVSFGCSACGAVIWAAYPRKSDGAKVVVLPKLFQQLDQEHRDLLLMAVNAMSSDVLIPATGLLQIPMYRLESDREREAFERLLSLAIVLTRNYYRER